MKLRMKRKAMVVLAAGMLMSAAAPAAAMAAEKATGPALTASYNGDVNTLEAAKDATQLIVVIGNRQDPAKSRLDWYKRDADGKLVQVMSKEAVSGMNGITMQKQEGDKKTPAGVYRFTMAFGLKANPGRFCRITRSWTAIIMWMTETASIITSWQIRSRYRRTGIRRRI